MEMTTSAEGQTQRLPDDLLAEVLRRLRATSPCSLAASRCVCKAWRAVVDTHGLLADLPPQPLTGIFVHLNKEKLPRHIKHASSPANITPFHYLDTRAAHYLMILQHCNGLLLLAADDEREEAWVLNPATRRRTRLPAPPPMCTPGMEELEEDDAYMDDHDLYLVFDPAVSPHYEVFLIKHVPFIPLPDMDQVVDDHVQQREWPPSTFVLLVFSSTTNRWEERPFVREGEAAGTIGDMLQAPPSDHWYAACWQGALYFHQRGLFMSINLTNDTYQVIEPPEGFHLGSDARHYLGKSRNGVYYALLDDLGLQVWYLDGTGDRMNWILRCDVDLHHLLAVFSRKHGDRPTKVQYAKFANCDEDDGSKATAEEDFGLDFDNDNATGDEDGPKHIRYSLLGYDPYEEIVFFHTPFNRVMAYHFNSPKIKEFCCLPVKTQSRISLSFPYTLCLMGEFSSNKQRDSNTIGIS